jgi:outer membrane protein OmpA-like peptidoglycan-associated protein
MNQNLLTSDFGTVVKDQRHGRVSSFASARHLMAAALLSAALALAMPSAAHAQKDFKGSADHALFPNRMPGFFIHNEQQLEFAKYQFQTRPPQTIEGRYTRLEYLLKKDQKNPGDLAIRRNYENAVKAAGGQVVYSDNYRSVLRVQRNGVEIWTQVETRPGGPAYFLHIVEREAMQQVITADAMAAEIDKAGFVALDIHFATAKAEILPESRPIIDQIVAMLKKRPTLRVAVEGHTDNTGSPAANKALSTSRAKAVADALTASDIAAARLRTAGYGQERPIADNRLEDGRARNRRVEIVKQ